MPIKSNAKSRMIEVAANLFQRQGYDGTGLTQILTESGAPKGSFYYHFPEGKEALAEAAIEAAGAEITDIIDKAFLEVSSFDQGVRNMASMVANWFKKSNYAEGCPITSVLLATTPQSPRLLSACQRVFSEWTSRISSNASDYKTPCDPDRLGVAMTSAIEGAWILSRATQTTAPFETAADMIIAYSKTSS